MGLEAKMVSPQFVTPFRMSQKNDNNDADAISVAAKQVGMRFVSPKSDEQLEIQMLHRTRERYMKTRTALINQTRGFLTEVGIVFPKGVSAFMKGAQRLLATLEQPRVLSRLLQALLSELLMVNQLIEELNEELNRVAKSNPLCRELQKLQAVGVMTSSAVVCAMGNPKDFKNGRNFAASLGLVPRQHSTGGRQKLGSITKCGDGYLRKLLVHGARSVVYHTVRQQKNDPLSLWIRKLYEHHGVNHTAVALANKTARRMWGVLAGKKPLTSSFETSSRTIQAC
jgi:transposase